MLPPEMTAALASLGQRDRFLRARGQKKTAAVTVSEGSISTPGTVRFAEDGEDAPLAAEQGSDYRLPKIIRKTEDQLTEVFIPENDNELWFDVEADRHYYFRFVILGRSADDTKGFRFALTTPGHSVFTANADVVYATGDATLALVDSGQTLTTPSVPETGEDFITTIEGVLITTDAGILQLKIACETGSTETTTIRRGSLAFLYDLGA